jgi:hypothetical protein
LINLDMHFSGAIPGVVLEQRRSRRMVDLKVAFAAWLQALVLALAGALFVADIVQAQESPALVQQ